jgi:ABC-type lipoprotein release transport system permease subunit
LEQGRFSFTEPSAANPWLLLESDTQDGAIPAIADANSLTYVLHKKVGEELVLPDGVRLRFVAALRDSVFQSELIISEARFLKAFPRQEGFRVFLIDAPEGKHDEVAADVENALSDQGIDVIPTAEKLAGFHRVENTYLSTFQMLGGLGLLLGTAGLAAILFRNVLERRRELALLASVGYRRSTLLRLVLAENLLLLFAGLAAGIAAAALAISPVIASRGFAASLVSMAGMLLLVAAAGVIATIVAAVAAMRQPLVSSLRAG